MLRSIYYYKIGEEKKDHIAIARIICVDIVYASGVKSCGIQYYTASLL